MPTLTFSNSPNQELFADPLSEVLRNAAPALLKQAVEAEVQGRLHQRDAPAGGPAPS
jgi:hypothetical protein